MILYHGSTIEVQKPQIITQNIGRDFGAAFYTTDIKEQAERWAKRRAMIDARQNIKSSAIVNIYDWQNVSSLTMKSFPEATLEWMDLVIQCRSNADYRHGYDIVIGKIADDNVGETISYVMQGIMRREDALKRLKFEKINNQVAFCTSTSLNTLTFIESYEVK